MPPGHLYDRLGGMPFFETLTRRFYDSVDGDDVLRPLYPEDLEQPRRHLCLFLAQFFGGPRTYEEQRGHPRLMARHLAFKIGDLERDRWLKHMTAAVKASGAGALEESQMLTYFAAAAGSLVNSHLREG